ncbi:MAG: TIGR03619 family F420-dependent LLM class oxidoreductase [Acidimicrobiales bacterium]
MKFGVGIPTCTAGMMYPTPFASVAEVVDIALEAEQLGYYEVTGNDHYTTPRYVRDSFSLPPDFFEPLITHAYIAAQTSVLRLMTGVLVFPMRQPVLLAKQLATLDQLSGGRVIVGAGTGAYREEFERALPHLAGGNRGRLMDETMAAVRLLLSECSATFHGEYLAFESVEMFPKPVQDPLPIYSAGNAEASIRRAALYGQGWLPAAVAPATIRAGKERLAVYAEEAGRGEVDFQIAPQLMVCMADTQDAAERTFTSSHLYRHLVTLQQSTLKDIDSNSFVANNLVGTPDLVSAKVAEFRDAGVGHLCGIYFAANEVDDLRDQMRRFAAQVMPGFG